MNLPNLITISRILLIPLLVIFLVEGKGDLALFVFILAGVGDAVDGFLARALNQQTDLGAFLDPIADKLLLVTSCITMAILNQLPAWGAVVIVSRDLIILGGIGVLLFYGHPLQIRPTFVSKVTTFLQILTVSMYMLGPDTLGSYWNYNVYLLYLASFFTIVSGLHYIYVGMQILDQEAR